MSEREYKPYDVLVYHDLDSFVEPQLGMNGRELGFDEDRSVVVIAPPIHPGKTATVVLGSLRPMPEMQAFFDAKGSTDDDGQAEQA